MRQRAEMAEKPELLCLGHDPILNRTRRLVFEKCFVVTLAHSVPEAISLLSRQRFDLVLLCYSLTDEECREAVERIHDLSAPSKILALAEARERLLLGAQDEEFLSGGPAELLQKAVAMAGIPRSEAEKCAMDLPAQESKQKSA
jgi:CheY-like chemotaxis protein